jgi:hypothetical protein
MFALVVERFEGIFIERGSGLEIWELFVERRRSVLRLVLQRWNTSGIGIRVWSDPLRREEMCLCKVQFQTLARL